MKVLLGVYSVVVFATLASALGAYLHQRRNEADQPPSGDNPHKHAPSPAGRAITERVAVSVPAEPGLQATGHRPSRIVP